MDLVRELWETFKTYQNNKEFIDEAVKDIEFLKTEGLTALKRGLDNRKRKFILKAVSLLVPSDVPAKVLEVDGVDDSELL